MFFVKITSLKEHSKNIIGIRDQTWLLEKNLSELSVMQDFRNLSWKQPNKYIDVSIISIKWKVLDLIITSQLMFHKIIQFLEICPWFNWRFYNHSPNISKFRNYYDFSILRKTKSHSGGINWLKIVKRLIIILKILT